MQFFVNPRIDFTGARRYAYMLSGAAVIATILLLSFGGLKMGVDFTGGHLVQVKFNDMDIDIGEVRSILRQADIGGVEVQTFGGEREFLIRLPVSQSGSGDRKQAEDVLRDAYPEALEVVRVEDVGPKIGGELKRDAVKAVVWALILLLVYISWRFEIRFAVGAVVALAHDVLITLGVFSLSGREMSLPVVAALLTIVGYSLNDTIVVFDRVREQLRAMRKEVFETVVNTSINKSLSRTVVTSLTTLAVVIILFIVGGQVINDFAFTLIIGVIVGTYSSIFVASPVVIEWHRFFSTRKSGERKSGPGRKSILNWRR